ncbi:MAG: cysteine synthase [bacterium]
MTKHMKYQHLLETIGNTPIIELKRYSPNSQITILAKLEGNNPGGSIKDRIALYMILDAQKKGILSKDKTIIEATSGNTGIGLAMIAAYLGYSFTAVMPESVSIERRKLLEAYGSKIILTEGKLGTNHAIEVAKNIVKENKDKYIQLDQFNNNMNVMAHYETTGKEIIHTIPTITHFVAGMGTGGTLMGVGKRLKKYTSNIQIIGIEPKVSSTIQGLRNMKAYVPSIYQESYLDVKLDLEHDEPAFELARDVFKREGVSVGISSGAALWGAIEVSKKIKKGVIVTVFPDRGDRYISTGLFAS